MSKLLKMHQNFLLPLKTTFSETSLRFQLKEQLFVALHKFHNSNWIWSFSFDGKWKMIFLKKYMEICYSLYILINVANMIFVPLQKKSKMIISRKNTLKGDWHSRSYPRKSSNDSLYFYGYLHRRFHILLSSEKNPGNLIYRIEIWLLLQSIWLEIFCNEESSILCTI